MIDAIEPLHCVLWAVAALAAGMYPLGLMLGGTCSQCCDTCDDVFEFDRCIRFENTVTGPLRTHFAFQEQPDEPIHGYSRKVRRPEDVGARRVGTKANLAVSIRLVETEPPSLSSMSDGETQSATFRYYYRKSALPGSELGTIKRWNVTLVGVTRPLTVPDRISELEYLVGPFAVNPYPIREYGVGVLGDSTSAPVSVSVHSVAIGIGSQFIDGAAVTDATFKSMLTATVPLRNGRDWVTRLQFEATPDVFKYVPVGSAVSLEYVIKHSRGSQNRFGSFAVRVIKTGGATVVPLPAGGLMPPLMPQPPYTNTPYAPASLKYSETDPDAVTLYSSDSPGVKSLKSVEITPTGEQLRYPAIYLDATNSASVNGHTHDSTFAEYGWIMRPYDPGDGFAFDSFYHPPENVWIYDTERVWSFLNGSTSVSYYPAIGSVFTMRVEGPTQFCGKSLCDVASATGNYSANAILYGDALERVVTMTVGKQPKTKIASHSDAPDGLDRFENACYGQDNIAPIPLFLGDQCKYSGRFKSCQGFAWNPPRLIRAASVLHMAAHPGDSGALTDVSVRAFYCGDLLWAIENGPCRQFITRDRPGFDGPDLLALGGDTAPYMYSDNLCPNGVRDGLTELCYPPEIEFTLSNLRKTGGVRPLTGEPGCHPCGSFPPYNAELSYPSSAGQIEGTYVLTGGLSSCIFLYYSATAATAQGAVNIDFGWSRKFWCKPFAFMPEIEPSEFSFGLNELFFVQVRHASPSYGLLFLENKVGVHGDLELVPADPPRGIPQAYYRCLGPISTCPQLNLRNQLAGGITYNPEWGLPIGSNVGLGVRADFSFSGLDAMVSPVAPSVSPPTATIPAEGGTASLTFCCPEKTVTVSAAAADRHPFGGFGAQGFYRFGDHKFNQTLVITDPSYPGVAGYVTQTGYNATKCPFDVLWLTGFQDLYEFALGPTPSRLFKSVNCPIEAQVSHLEQPGCEWSVSSSESWLVAEKSNDGLLRLSIDWNQPAEYTGSLPAFSSPSPPYRTAIVTISSKGTQREWMIVDIPR